MSDPRWDPDLASGMRRVVAGAVAWSAVSQAGRQLVQFAVAPILAWLVGAEEFGLIAMAMVVMLFFMTLNDLGARSALQREPRLNEPLVCGVFWMNAGLGLACALATAALARPVAWFYDEPRLAGILFALSPVFLLTSLGFVSLSLLQRKLRQRVLSTIELVAALGGAAAAIASALAGAGAYAVILQNLVSGALLTILAMAMAPVPLFVRWRFADVRPVVGYSVRLTIFSAVNALARNADYVLLGRLAGPEVTGLYYLAYRLIVDPVSQLAAIIGRISLPVLAHVSAQSDEARLRSLYLRITGSVAVATFPATLGMLAVHRELLAVLASEWTDASIFVILLVPVGLVQALFASIGSLYMVRGRMDLMLRVGVAWCVALVLALVAGACFGATGIALAYSLAMLVLVTPVLSVPLGLIGLKPADVGREVLRPLLAASVMAGIVTLLRPLVGGLPPVGALLVLVACGVAAYGAVLHVVDRERVRDLIGLLRSRN